MSATRPNGEPAESLRQTNEVSIRRAEFAIKVRDIAAYGRALRPAEWSKKRHAFLDAYIRHVLVLPAFVDFYNYLPRVIGLCVSCRDFRHLRNLVDALEDLLNRMGERACVVDCEVDPKEIASRFRAALADLVEQVVESSFPATLTRGEVQAYKEAFPSDEDTLWGGSWRFLTASSARFFRHDLGYWPLKRALLPSELYPDVVLRRPYRLPVLARRDAGALLTRAVTIGAATFSELTKVRRADGELPIGVLFPTRPPRLQELYALHQEPFGREGPQHIAECLLAFRGFKPRDRLPQFRERQLFIASEKPTAGRLSIAVASWETDERSWVAAVTKQPDPDQTRYDRLRGLINSVLRSRRRPTYLVMPELSIPPRWFLEIAAKLHANGISLISGVDYLHARRNVVRNQVWAGLAYDGLGFRSQMIYCQDKQRPAAHEESNLYQVGGRVLRPANRWKTPPVVIHGDFHFALLLCSELTNIENRASLRGSVDALIVPEWNQDTETFSALVESAALDIHAYVVQCNARQYGDSRIRAPARDSWMRDIVRIKGGREDYFVVGEIDTKALRRFQSAHRSPAKPFKPVPDGFVMDRRRRTLP